ncbi:MAG TPA: hypothetical protein VG028_02180 [Terriglobia bacterium]|nr:hypothetical protein [Terriglobia bacterium]
MKRDPTYLFDFFMLCAFLFMFTLWLVHEGYGWGQSCVIFATSLTLVTIVSVIRWRRVEALPFGRRSARFSRRNQLKANAIGVGALLMIAPEWDRRTIVLFAVVIFGLGNIASLVEWLLWRRYVRQMAESDRQNVLPEEVHEGQ